MSGSVLSKHLESHLIITTTKYYTQFTDEKTDPEKLTQLTKAKNYKIQRLTHSHLTSKIKLLTTMLYYEELFYFCFSSFFSV